MNKYIHERYENNLGYAQTTRTERDYEKSSGAYESTQEILKNRSYAQGYHERQLEEPKISLMEMLAYIEKSLESLGDSIDKLNETFYPVIRISTPMVETDQVPKSSHHSGAVTTAININEKIGNLQQRIIDMIERSEL